MSDSRRNEASGAPEEELSSLRASTPAPRAQFIDDVMRQVATRPLPRQSLWRRMLGTREVTLRVRPVTLAVTMVAVVLLLVVALRARPTATVIVQAPPPPAHDSAQPPRDTPVLVRFAVAAPNARTVSLAGDFNGWRADATPLERGPDGVWSAHVPLSRGNWSYSFVVDGKWVEDPLAETWRADGFGGKNAVVRVGDVPSLEPSRGG